VREQAPSRRSYIYIKPQSDEVQCTVIQWRLFKFDLSLTKFPGSGTEITPGKHPDTRITPLPFTNGHGLYITVTPERTLVSVG
jgi:hypothetical protein